MPDLISGDRRAHLYSLERWQYEALDISLWHERTEYMVALLRRYLSNRGEQDADLEILEFGCGSMALESMLREGGFTRARYIPSDCHARDERTLVLDLNAPDFLDSVPAVDVIFMGGVLEYLDRAESVLDALSKKARYLFFSYCPRVASQTEADRLGWKNHWTPGEALAIANDLGDGVMSESGFDPSAPKPVHTYFVASRNWWRPELAAAAGPLPKIHDRPVRCPSG